MKKKLESDTIMPLRLEAELKSSISSMLEILDLAINERIPAPEQDGIRLAIDQTLNRLATIVDRIEAA